MKGQRADVYIVSNGLAASREKAQAIIKAGLVYCDNTRIDKPGAVIGDGQTLTVHGEPIPFVSRGGLKLDKAIHKYDLRLDNLVAVDIGASTGGFTDCMLQNGARLVYAIDVGHGQLDKKLRDDPRVIVMEKTNAREMRPEWFPELPSFAATDVSFISVRLILPGIYNCLADGGYAVVLVKPQFEAGRERVGKNGVVRDPAVHADVLRGTADAARELGFSVCTLDFSPIKGPQGNIEFLMILKKDGAADSRSGDEVSEVVAAAHEFFN